MSHPSAILQDLLALLRSGSVVELPTPTEVAGVRAALGGLQSQQAEQATITFAPAAAGTVTINAAVCSIAKITMPAGNITIAAPTNPTRVGQRLVIIPTQDGVGSRTITWNAVFKKSADGAGSAGQSAIIEFVWDGTNWWKVGPAVGYVTLA